jgi:preprotein translocase subunit SecA
MDYLQEGIGLRAVGQRDPLIEYQKEGYDLFIAMMDGIKEESVGFLFNVQVNVEEEQAAQEPAVSSGADDAHALFQAAEAEALPVTGGKAGGNGARVGNGAKAPAKPVTALPKALAAPPRRPANLQYSAPTSTATPAARRRPAATPASSPARVRRQRPRSARARAPVRRAAASRPATPSARAGRARSTSAATATRATAATSGAGPVSRAVAR